MAERHNEPYGPEQYRDDVVEAPRFSVAGRKEFPLEAVILRRETWAWHRQMHAPW